MEAYLVGLPVTYLVHVVEKLCVYLLAVCMSYLSADDLKRFIGGDRTAKGMAR